jgi:hypothetical protein
MKLLQKQRFLDLTVKIYFKQYACKESWHKEMSVFPHALDFSKEQIKTVIPRYSLLADQIVKIAAFSETENYLHVFIILAFALRIP